MEMKYECGCQIEISEDSLPDGTVILSADFPLTCAKHGVPVDASEAFAEALEDALLGARVEKKNPQ